MFLIPSEKAKTLTIDENGKLQQWLWKQKFMKTITQKLSVIVKLLTMKHPIEDSQRTKLKSTTSIFSIHELNKTPKMTTDALDCDNIVLNQENESVLNAVH